MSASFLMSIGFTTAIGVLLNFVLSTIFVVKNYLKRGEITLNLYFPVVLLAFVSSACVISALLIG